MNHSQTQNNAFRRHMNHSQTQNNAFRRHMNHSQTQNNAFRRYMNHTQAQNNVFRRHCVSYTSTRHQIKTTTMNIQFCHQDPIRKYPIIIAMRSFNQISSCSCLLRLTQMSLRTNTNAHS